jgi:arylformamidase
MQQITARWASNSELFRTRWGVPARLSYGTGSSEHLDLYRSKNTRAPIQIFIHGGAWRAGLAKDYAFAAEIFLNAGSHFVVPDFSPVHDAGGNLAVMAEQVQRAVSWVWKNAPTLGGDPGRIYLSAHSSGAHLAAVALTMRPGADCARRQASSRARCS